MHVLRTGKGIRSKVQVQLDIWGSDFGDFIIVPFM